MKFRNYHDEGATSPKSYSQHRGYENTDQTLEEGDLDSMNLTRREP